MLLIHSSVVVMRSMRNRYQKTILDYLTSNVSYLQELGFVSQEGEGVDLSPQLFHFLLSVVLDIVPELYSSVKCFMTNLRSSFKHRSVMTYFAIKTPGRLEIRINKTERVCDEAFKEHPVLRGRIRRIPV